jgi:hypothetical protein
MVGLEGLGQLKKNPLIGTRTRYLPACSIVPQPTTLRLILKALLSSERRKQNTEIRLQILATDLL